MGHKLAKKEFGTRKSFMESIYGIYKVLLDICISIYMLFVIIVIPIYHVNGYYGIATSKEMAFMKVARDLLVLFAVEIVLMGLLLFFDKKSWKEKIKRISRSFSITEWCAICYGIVLCCSFLFTDYRIEALWGAEGWYMGFFVQLTLLVAFFQIVHIWKKRLWIFAMIFPASMLQFLLGYLNRFGIYPFEMPGSSPLFISLIGNINWYCGYMVTVLFAVVYLVWKGIANRIWEKVFLYGYLLIGFASLVTQGSSSGIMTLAGVLVLLFYLSVRDGKKMYYLCSIVLLLSVACLFTWIIRQYAPDAITYREPSIELLTNTMLSLILTVLFGGMVLCLNRLVRISQYPERIAVGCAKGITVIIVTAVVVSIFIMVYNGMFPGRLGVLSKASLFNFSPEWGSKRGATWMAGLMCFAEQGIGKKMIGIGPDCMGIYVRLDASEQIKALIMEQFATLKLTNAHNEWITVLVDYGILGFVAYVGMLTSAILRYIKIGIKGTGTRAWVAGACGLGIFAYTIHNMVSFQQVTNTSIMYILLGIGEVYAKSDK